MFNRILAKRKKQLEEQNKLIEKSIQERVEYLDSINSLISQEEGNLTEIQNKLSGFQERLQQCQAEIGLAEGIIAMQDMGIEYTPCSNQHDTLAFRKNQIQEEIAELLSNDEAIAKTRGYTLDGSSSKGDKFQKIFCENMMAGFTAYYEKKKKAATVANIGKTELLIRKKFESINKKNDLLGMFINKSYLELCIKLLYAELDEKIAKAEERERIKEERRRLREQEKLLAEAEKERKRLEEERHNLQKLFAKAITEQEQEDIKNKLAEVDKRTEEIDWRISHQSAGWLYIATTPCLEGMYKAGCTKQLNPLNRLAQLSSASVPYPFECHGLVFSEDVFDLEAKLHKRLDSVRVNKMNKGKEFFYGSPEEAIKILKEEFKVEVHFVDESWVEEE